MTKNLRLGIAKSFRKYRANFIILPIVMAFGLLMLPTLEPSRFRGIVIVSLILTPIAAVIEFIVMAFRLSKDNESGENTVSDK